MVIVRNKKHGTEDRMSDAEAERLKSSKYGKAFEFIAIHTPPEVEKIEEPKTKKPTK